MEELLLMNINEYFKIKNDSTIISNLNQGRVVLKNTPTIKNKLDLIANMKEVQYNTSNYMNPRRKKT